MAFPRALRCLLQTTVQRSHNRLEPPSWEIAKSYWAISIREGWIMQWEDRVGRRLKLRDLHTLQIVSEFGSMARASQQLGLSQPAISKAIGEMEQALGARLLDRSSVGVELTAPGRLLVDRTRLIFDEVRQGVKDIEYLSDPTRGEVRIGITEPNTSSLAEAIARLSKRYPNIHHHVEITDTTTMMRLLRER